MTFFVRCQELDCSSRSDYEILAVFHGRCAAALVHSGVAQWQNNPLRPPAKSATGIGVDVHLMRMRTSSR